MKLFNQTETYKLHQLVFCLDNVAMKALEKNTNISYVQFLILITIQENPEFKLEQIGDWVNLTKSAVSQQIEKLVQASLLNRTENPQDRREKKLKLTVSGHAELEKAKEICNQLSENLFESLSPADRKSLNNLLNNLISNIPSKLIKTN
ncbi:MAG: hypothetical protein OHK0017_04850 [Patescibacteria group bacterium]